MSFIFRHPSFYKKLKANNKTEKTKTPEKTEIQNSFNQPSLTITDTISSTATTKTKRVKKT